ncbi:MAG: hypothetical protein LM577_05865 [Thermoproteaceae archaeon]|nr:hypothetical protein [Thermoproteaceae archaeon]
MRVKAMAGGQSRVRYCLDLCAIASDEEEKRNCVLRCLNVASSEIVGVAKPACPSSEGAMHEFYELLSRIKKYLHGLEGWQIASRIPSAAYTMLGEGYDKETAKRMLIDTLDKAVVDRYAVRRAYLHGTRPEVVEILKEVFPNVRSLPAPAPSAKRGKTRRRRPLVKKRSEIPVYSTVIFTPSA